MNPQTISLISIFINFALGITKVIFGFFINSTAVIADGLESGLDVISSFITFLGLRIAKKPVDKTHPYGYFKAESLAGFVISLFLLISGIWILYEATKRFLSGETVTFSINAIIMMIVSILVTELMARWKFHFGKKHQSLVLVADAEHSRSDVLASTGVLIGLGLSRYFSFADNLIAWLIGGYIIFEAFKIGREITDSLLDVANQEIEERIEKICRAHKIEIADLKTRKIGAFNFAEIKIKLAPKLKVDEVAKITAFLEEKLLNNIPELKQIVISIEPYQMTRSVIVPAFGGKICSSKGFERIGPKKLGKRIIVPWGEGEISSRFGASQYLIIDVKNNQILTKEIVKNPYFEEGTSRGTRFAKAVRADKVLVRQIGPNAKQNLENSAIEIIIVPPGKDLKQLLEEIKFN